MMQPVQQPTFNAQTIDINFQTPSGCTRCSFVKTEIVANTIFALWQIDPSPSDRAFTCNLGHACLKSVVVLPDSTPGPLPVKHFLMNRDWNWWQGTEGVTFVNSQDEFDSSVAACKV